MASDALTTHKEGEVILSGKTEAKAKLDKMLDQVEKLAD